MIGTQEWRDQNRDTLYPFEPQCSLTSNDGVQLDRSLLADAQLHPVGGLFGSYLSRVTVDQSGLVLQFGDEGTDARCWASLTGLADTAEVFDFFNRPAGILVAGSDRFASVLTLPAGQYDFDRENTRLCATCYHAVPDDMVSGFRLPSGEILSGDVWFVGRNGVQFDLVDVDRWNEQGQSLSGEEVKLNVVGDPLRRRRDCGPVGRFETPRFLRRLLVKHGVVTVPLTPDKGTDVILATNGTVATETSLRVTQAPPEIIFKFSAEGS